MGTALDAQPPKEIATTELPIEYYDFIVVDGAIARSTIVARRARIFRCLSDRLTATPSKQTFGFFKKIS